MTQSAVALIVTLVVSADGASVWGAGAHVHSRGFLEQSMRPDVAARTLVQVQDKWRAEAATVAESNTTDGSDALQDYEKSCSAVVQAVMVASSGDRASVKEYMDDVCGQADLEGWHKTSCQSFASAIEGSMTEDAFDNRESLDTVKLCRTFWSGFAEEERQRVAEERAARVEAEKKAEEERAEAEKKAAEERAEAEKKAEEEAAEAKKRADEEAAKREAEEIARRAEDAKRLAEEASAKLAAKKAEAEKMAEEAEHKMEEAKSAAEETKRYQSEANQTANIAQKLQDINLTSKVSANSSFLQRARSSMRLSKQPVDDGDEFEHGDLEANARAEDPSDYSVHQFLAHDDGREGSDDSGDSDDGAAAEMAKNAALAKEDHFDSEDTPDDSFLQTGNKLSKLKQPMDDDGDEFEHGDMEANARAEDPSDYSVHQFLAHDDGREGSDDSGDSDDGAAAEMAKNKALAKEDHFDSEDTPDQDSFVQMGRSLQKVKQPTNDDDGDEFEHGDLEANARAEDPSDYSVHQFLAHDDGREGSDDSGDSDDGAAAEMAKNKALAKEDHFDSEDTPDNDSFLQMGRALKNARQPMNDDDGDEYEHGDMEANARAEDPSDYSVHQFLAHDDGREGSDDSADSDDGAAAEMAKNKALAKEDHFDSEDTPDDSFVQMGHTVTKVRQPMDDGDEFEHGDMEANARAEDPSDYSVHQFLAHDDGREGSDDSGDSDDGAAAEIAKNKALAKEDHFDSEDTPDQDSFIQIRRVEKMTRQPMDDDGDEFEHGDMEANARAEDPSDYSVHQFLAHDDGREGSDDSGDSDDGAAAEIAKNKALAKEDHFDSEDTPDEDSFIQIKRVEKMARQPMDDDGDEFEHGDLEANARAEDPSDYSVHQFLAHDDGREGSDDSGDSDDGAAAEIAKNKALAKEDHFDSEDTPDDSFVQMGRASKKNKQPMSDDDGDEFEHGDMEANARAEDPSDYSVHQFLAHDDGREGSDDSGDSDDGAAAEMAKNKAMAKDDHFDSEDTPDMDA